MLATACRPLNWKTAPRTTALRLIGLPWMARQMDEFEDTQKRTHGEWRVLLEAAIRPLLREVR